MTRALLALAALAVAVIALRPRRTARALLCGLGWCRCDFYSPEADDSEAVMVPMTWSVPPGYFIELAPTSRN